MYPVSFMCNFTTVLLKWETHGGNEIETWYQALKNILVGSYWFLYVKTEIAYETSYQMFWTDIMWHRFIDKIVPINCQ